MSKGSSPRPFSVNRDQFNNNWNNIFGKNNEKEKVVNDQKVSYNQEHQSNQENSINERAVD